MSSSIRRTARQRRDPAETHDPAPAPTSSAPAPLLLPEGPPMSTIVRGRWYPASVVLPDGRNLRKTFVVLAEGGEHAGLHVYTRPNEVTFHAGVNWLRQQPIPTGRKARTGIDVQLTDGSVAVITPGAECRCGQLGRWAGPEWSHTVSARRS